MFLDSQMLLDIKIYAWAGLRSAGASPKPELRAALAKAAVKSLGSRRTRPFMSVRATTHVDRSRPHWQNLAARRWPSPPLSACALTRQRKAYVRLCSRHQIITGQLRIGNFEVCTTFQKQKRNSKTKLLGQTIDEYDIWHASSDGYIGSVNNIPKEVVASITEAEIKWLSQEYDSPEFRRIRRRYIEIFRALKDTKEITERSALVEESNSLLDSLSQ